MSEFWRCARLMLRYPWSLTAALVLAALSAAGLGVGLASVVPILHLVIEKGSLPEMARQFNAADHVVSVPAGLIELLPADPWAGVVMIIVSLCVLAIFGATASFLHQYLSFTVAARTITRVRQQAFHHIVNLSLVKVVERGPSEYVARVVRDAAELQRGFMALASKSVAQVTRGIACFTVALFVSWEVAAVAVVSGVLLAVVLKKLGRRVRRGTRGSLQAQESLLRIATESVQGLRTVKVNTAEAHATRRFHRENRKVLREEIRARTARAMSGPIVETMATWLVSGLAIVFAGRILAGAMEPGQFVVALGSLAAAGASFKPLAGIINEIQASSAPAGRLHEIMDEPREITRRARRPVVMRRHRRSIEFDRVGFSYPGSRKPALEDVSLKINHGERVVLVGPNGSGKTTLVSLLPRLLRPISGRILIDGVDIESVSLRGLRRQIAVVTQESVLFRGSVSDNIALGAEGVTRARIEEAAAGARADEFIRELRGGYEADLAEQGASLSGGQRQRLAIARAILRDPSILILDEATSQIDSESEALIAAALQEFCRDRTAIIIAHRFASVLDADRIVVMDQGRLVDQGPHRELMHRCDLYARLTKTQLVGG